MPSQSDYVAKNPDGRGNIRYSDEEHRIWHDLIVDQLPRVSRFAATEYLDGLAKLELPEDRIPQCSEISVRLSDYTGWKVEPVPALIGFGRFFDLLANRTFPAASFIRRREHFNYIEEPDIFHEIFGHTPLLTDPRFADFSQAIGRAGCAVDPADYSWLIRLYWFTIEFGLTHRCGRYQAFGSGLASSPTELPYSVQNSHVQRVPFDVISILRTPYLIDIQQPLYYVLANFDDLFEVPERDLAKDIKKARKLGLLAPLFERDDGDDETRQAS